MFDLAQVMSYYENVKQPWGRLFYDTLFAQLDIDNAPRMRILDFGSGFGITAAHLAARHEVVAIEPNAEMRKLRVTEPAYTQLEGGFEVLGDIPDATFDYVLCHNVLEYVDNQQQVVKALMSKLRPGGKLSVVRHNLAGKVMHHAVAGANPGDALALLNGSGAVSQTLGPLRLFSSRQLDSYVGYDVFIYKRYGLRIAFALIQDNAIKYDDAWYQQQLALETRLCDMEPYRDIGFFEHRIYLVY